VINSGSKVAEGLPADIITEELIKRVYDIEVKKADIDGKSIIYPVL
jgi:iron complex transport system ATP-binding protein